MKRRDLPLMNQQKKDEMISSVNRRQFILGTAAVGTTLAMGRDLAAESDAPLRHRAAVKTVADAVLRDFPQPPLFNWGEGVLLTGMMRAYRLTKDPRYLDFVRRFGDHHHERGIEATLRQRGYCGHWGPGFPMLMLFEETGQERYLELAQQISDFMISGAERTADGGLSHFNGKPQLWVDTLDMCCPVFSNLARLTDRPELQEEAIRQLEIFAHHLQDPKTGLFYHMWDEKTGKHTPEFWARGNGWVVMSYAEVLKNEKPDLSSRCRSNLSASLCVRTKRPDCGTRCSTRRIRTWKALLRRCSCTGWLNAEAGNCWRSPTPT